MKENLLLVTYTENMKLQTNIILIICIYYMAVRGYQNNIDHFHYKTRQHTNYSSRRLCRGHHKSVWFIFVGAPTHFKRSVK
jgi:hypothetical protein